MFLGVISAMMRRRAVRRAVPSWTVSTNAVVHAERVSQDAFTRPANQTVVERWSAVIAVLSRALTSVRHAVDRVRTGATLLLN